MPNPVLMRKLRGGNGAAGIVPLPGWDHPYEIFEDYTVGAAIVQDNKLAGGKGWAGKAAVRPTYARQLLATDDLSTYADGADLDGLNGGASWAGAWRGPAAVGTGVQRVSRVSPFAYNVLTGAAAAVDPTEATMSAWVWFANKTATMNIVGRTDSTAGASSPFLYHDGTNIKACAVDTVPRYVTDPTAVVAQKWYHVCLTFKNSGFVNLYVNGASVGAPAAFGTHWTGGDRWRLFQGNTISPGYFAGMVADLAVWTKELTAAEVAQLATGTRDVPPTIQSGSLLCYFPFDTLADGAGSVWNAAWQDDVGTVTQGVVGRVSGRLVNFA